MNKQIFGLISAFLFCAVLPAHAVSEKCVSTHFLNMLGKQLGTSPIITDFTEYEFANSILVLSDGAWRPSDAPLAPQLAAEFPAKKIFQTDSEIPGTIIHGNGNFISRGMSNTERFPFENDSMDLIVLRKGMCFCKGDISCSGVCNTHQEMKHFFSEISRVLNKNNPNAKAILHGTSKIEQKHIILWTQVAIEVEAEYGVTVSIEKSDRNFFKLLVIRPSKVPNKPNYAPR